MTKDQLWEWITREVHIYVYIIFSSTSVTPAGYCDHIINIYIWNSFKYWKPHLISVRLLKWNNEKFQLDSIAVISLIYWYFKSKIIHLCIVYNFKY